MKEEIVLRLVGIRAATDEETKTDKQLILSIYIQKYNECLWKYYPGSLQALRIIKTTTKKGNISYVLLTLGTATTYKSFNKMEEYINWHIGLDSRIKKQSNGTFKHI